MTVAETIEALKQLPDQNAPLYITGTAPDWTYQKEFNVDEITHDEEFYDEYKNINMFPAYVFNIDC